MHFVDLSFSIDILRPFTFKLIIKVHKSAILVFVLCLFPLILVFQLLFCLPVSYLNIFKNPILIYLQYFRVYLFI